MERAKPLALGQLRDGQRPVERHHGERTQMAGGEVTALQEGLDVAGISPACRGPRRSRVNAKNICDACSSSTVRRRVTARRAEVRRPAGTSDRRRVHARLQVGAVMCQHLELYCLQSNDPACCRVAPGPGRGDDRGLIGHDPEDAEPTMRTRLTELLGIEHPVMLAGMGGVSYAPLVAAVCEAGGFGCLGASTMGNEQMVAEIAAVRAATDKPFGVDLLTAMPGA